MAVGSSIVNLTASGLPTETEDRAYSFCLGTQILQNPSQDPRTGTLSFKISPNQFDVGVTGDAVGTTAIGLATSTNISTVSTWSAATEIQDDGISYGIFALSVAEKDGDGGKVNVATAGQSIATVVKNRTASGTSSVENTFESVSHGYTAGDAVVVASGTVLIHCSSIPLILSSLRVLTKSCLRKLALLRLLASAMKSTSLAPLVQFIWKVTMYLNWSEMATLVL